MRRMRFSNKHTKINWTIHIKLQRSSTVVRNNSLLILEHCSRHSVRTIHPTVCWGCCWLVGRSVGWVHMFATTIRSRTVRRFPAVSEKKGRKTILLKCPPPPPSKFYPIDCTICEAKRLRASIQAVGICW